MILIGSSRYRIKAVEQPDNQIPCLQIGDDAISIITSIRYLGVQVDQFLNWDEHLMTISNKVSRGLEMLRYAKRYLALVTVQAMYKASLSRTSDTAALSGELQVLQLCRSYRNCKTGQ